MFFVILQNGLLRLLDIVIGSFFLGFLPPLLQLPGENYFSILSVLNLVTFSFLDLFLLVDTCFKCDQFVRKYDNRRLYSHNQVVESTLECYVTK